MKNFMQKSIREVFTYANLVKISNAARVVQPILKVVLTFLNNSN